MHAPRRADRLLRQPAAVGVAAGPARDDPAVRRPHARDLSVRGGDLRTRGRAGRVRRAIRSSTSRTRATAREAFLRAAGLDPAEPVLALLPGSRPNELRHVLPALADAAPLIARARAGRAVPRRARAGARRRAVRAARRDARRRDCRRRRRPSATDDVLAAADVVVDRVGHRDRAGGAARRADGHRLSAVAADLRDRQAIRAGARRTAW